MTRRSRAREVTLQLLYEADLNEDQDRETTDAFLRARLTSPEMMEFSRSLFEGVRRNRAELDAILVAYAENWSLSRMAATDRNILRLGTYEIVFADTPGRVAINEAVELAKRFGGRQSPQFVNGILDRVLAEHRK